MYKGNYDNKVRVCLCVRFNMVAFSGEVRLWQAGLVQSTEDLCKEAVQWLNQLSTHGGSCTLQALQVPPLIPHCIMGRN